MKGLLLNLVVLTLMSALLIEAGLVPQSGRKERKGFKLLGSVKKAKSVSSVGMMGIASISSFDEDWDYWESVNSAGWAAAKRDCEANGDTLLYMETREEVDNVTRWLQDSDNTGSQYWMGGKYDTRSKAFIWDNGVPINPHAPWGPGQPKDKKANARVVATTIGREIELKTQANTASNRYICEGGKGDEIEAELPEPCYNDNDLVVVIDSSGSIGNVEYEVAKEFTARLAATWVDHVGSRVSVLIYSSDARKIFGLTDDQRLESIKNKVYNMQYLRGTTASNLGIDLAIQEFQANGRNVQKNMVFLTDGYSDSKNRTKTSADMAKSLGIRAYSVGIGSYLDQAELLAIAGGVTDHIFSTDQFDKLLRLLRPLSRKVCER